VDAGRRGFRKYGIPSSGAMDPFAFRASNILAGNPEDAAALEINLTGPRLAFLSDTVIAITGADFSPELNGAPAAMWESLFIKKGDELAFGTLKHGCRSYISFAGGVDVPYVMGSRTTFSRAGIGGYGGRPLRAGDVVKTGETGVSLTEVPRKRLVLPPMYTGSFVLRAVPGPQDDYFPNHAMEAFWSGEYVVGPQYDRMGYRLEGPVLRAKGSHDIVSEGVIPGSVQVPGDGKPIIIMEDGQTAGGYAKIATVISRDLSFAAQAKAGDRIRFERVSVGEAHRILAQAAVNVETLEHGCPSPGVKARRFHVLCSGRAYDVFVEER
jgi:biotin-dependent carboxylase-like uncharacterized protein